MVLIQSSGEDFSTTSVAQWLLYYQQPFIRLNDIVAVRHVKYINGNITITLPNNKELALANITAYWYRRGLLGIERTQLDRASRSFKKAFSDLQKDDHTTLGELIQAALNEKQIRLGNPYTDITVNKLKNLSAAAQHGLLVPDSIVTSSKEDVLAFKKKWGRIITKPLNNAIDITSGSYWYPSYTTEITDENIGKIPNVFKESLFQQAIEKKVEVRVFYLMGESYAMAIFSQNDAQTKTDFRNYNYDKPNRNIPFALPQQIKEKLHLLMQALHYSTGSIDLIYTPKKKFYFLEINPVGQFGMVSYPCNYYLERRIAQILTNAKQQNNG